MSGHTPGEWVVNGFGGAFERVATLAPAGVQVSASQKPTPEEEIPNSRLIAAAPEMLAKLEKVRDWLTRLADAAERRAKDTRFLSLAEAEAADAKNYRATAADLSAVITKAVGR